MMQYSSFSDARWANADHTAINAMVVFDAGAPAVAYRCAKTDDVSAALFAAIVAAGGIADYVAAAPTAAQVRAAIAQACALRIAQALQGRDGSLLREAVYLQNLGSQAVLLTDEQKAEVVMFQAINAWESAMVDKREALIAAGDLAAAQLDATWPPAPAGLADFLNGF